MITTKNIFLYWLKRTFHSYKSCSSIQCSVSIFQTLIMVENNQRQFSLIIFFLITNSTGRCKFFVYHPDSSTRTPRSKLQSAINSEINYSARSYQARSSSFIALAREVIKILVYTVLPHSLWRFILIIINNDNSKILHVILSADPLRTFQQIFGCNVRAMYTRTRGWVQTIADEFWLSFCPGY